MTMTATERLYDLLVVAGVPVDGVGRNRDGTLRIDYASSATNAQRQTGDAILAGFDPSAPASRTRQERVWAAALEAAQPLDGVALSAMTLGQTRAAVALVYARLGWASPAVGGPVIRLPSD